MTRSFKWLYRLLRPVADPLKMSQGLRGYRWFIRDWRAYKQLPQAEPLRLTDAYPNCMTARPFPPSTPLFLRQRLGYAASYRQ